MCLSKLDEKIKNHRVGYKVFIQEKNRKKLKTPYFGQRYYPIGKWISDYNEEYIGSHEGPYKSGFHYYLNQQSAFSQIGTSGSYVVYKVLAREKICTGVDGSSLMHCGVCREMFIKDKLVKKYISPNEEKKRRYRKLKQALKVKEIATLAEKIYKAQQKALNLESLYKEYSKLVTKNIETFCEWIAFVDHFSRQSIRFHSLTSFHSYALKNFPKHLKYYQIVSDEHKFIEQPHIDCIPKEVDF
jgi:hypothetical protein